MYPGCRQRIWLQRHRDALHSDDWQLQFGFDGMQADGDYEQMMLARLRMNL